MRGRKRALLTIVVGVAVLGALYPVIRALHDQRGAAGASETFRLDIPAARPDSPPRGFDVRTFEDFPVFKARQGGRLTLTIHSERGGAIHIHGYEKHVELVPNGDVTVSFEAKNAGLFPVHLHGTDHVMAHVATFEIQPQ